MIDSNKLQDSEGKGSPIIDVNYIVVTDISDNATVVLSKPRIIVHQNE